MRTFDTPQPITATLELTLGDVRASAGERTQTVVTVDPLDPSNAEDRQAAELTRVEYASGRLLVKAPRLRSWLPRRTGGSISVSVELPAGSHLHGTAAVADFHGDGSFGECRIRTSVGRIELGRVQVLSVKSGTSDVDVDVVAGDAEIAIASGEVRVGELGSGARIKKSNGDTWIGFAGGDVDVAAANGSIAVDRANAAVQAKTAKGDIRLREVARGAVVLETHVGDVAVGIPEGTSAWLDVRSTAGRVDNALDAADTPGPSTETVEVRARTTLGDILIGRPATDRVSA